MTSFLRVCRVFMTGAFVLTLSTAGCAPLVADTAKSATPAAVKGGAAGLADPKTEMDLRQFMTSPEMKEAIAGLITAVSDGSLNALDDATRSQRLQGIIERFVADVTPQVAHSMMPVIDETTRTALRAAIAEMTSERSVGEVSKMTTAVSDAMVDAVTKRAASGLRDDLGPALAATLKNDIVPAMTSGMNPDSMAAMSRTMGKSFILGANDALADIDTSGRSIVERAATARVGAFPWLMITAFTLAMGLAALGAAYWVASKRSARLRRTLVILAAELDGDEKEAWTGELIDVLSDGTHDTRLTSRLAALLKARRKREAADKGGFGVHSGSVAPAE